MLFDDHDVWKQLRFGERLKLKGFERVRQLALHRHHFVSKQLEIILSRFGDFHFEIAPPRCVLCPLP